MARRKAASKAVASETRLDWIPGETPLSNLGPEEIKKRLGLQVNEAELQATAKAIVAVEAMSALRAIAVPTSVDWRNGNWITPIKDQASCGSCVSFGTLATL